MTFILLLLDLTFQPVGNFLVCGGFKNQWSTPCSTFGALLEYFWDNFGVILEHFWSTFGLLLEYFFGNFEIHLEYFWALLEYFTSSWDDLVNNA